MSLTPVATIREIPIPGPVPRYEIPGWREQYGVVAGITARGGELGRGFDLGLWTDAPVVEVMTRWRTFRTTEPGFGAVILGHQVHGKRVRWHRQANGWVQFEGLDGHATTRPGLLLCVTVADCIPVYLVDPKTGALALLHAGWRGTAAGILPAAVELLLEAANSTVTDIVMHCGIGICAPCYEVGSEVMAGCGLPAPGAGPWHLGLREVLADQARMAGIRQISTSQWCSSHDHPLFYSHRASKGRDGRMVAYLGRPDRSGESGAS
jgi:YfiH family protein